jgi:hypothetical protein
MRPRAKKTGNIRSVLQCSWQRFFLALKGRKREEREDWWPADACLAVNVLNPEKYVQLKKRLARLEIRQLGMLISWEWKNARGFGLQLSLVSN